MSNDTNAVTGFGELPKLGAYLADYQEQALRTAVEIEDGMKNAEHFAVGLAEEAGELLGLYKKAEFFGHHLDTAKLTGELGDLLWYAVGLLDAINVDVAELMASDTCKGFVEMMESSYAPVAGLSSERANPLIVLAPTVFSLNSVTADALRAFIDLRSCYASGGDLDQQVESMHIMIDAALFSIGAVSALAEDALGESLTFVAEANLRKLRARYPGKFDADASLNRNEAAEQAAIAG